MNKRGNFVAILRAKIARTTRAAASEDFDVREGVAFRSGVNSVRHDQVLYKGKEAGKLQYKTSPHTGQTLLEVHDGEEAHIGGHYWQMLIETCQDTSEHVIDRTYKPKKGRGRR